MKRLAPHWIIAAGLVIFTAASLHADESLLRQAANAINEAKSGQCEAAVTMKSAQQNRLPPLAMRMLWQSDACRIERLVGSRPISWEVRRMGKPGLAVDRQSRTYNRTRAATEQPLPLQLLTAMNDVPPENIEDLGTMRIGNGDARGFSTGLQNLPPDTGKKGTLTMWVDQDSKLPVLVVHEDQIHTIRMEKFKWNIPLESELFDVQPPDDYDDKTREPPNDKELAQILGALKTYAAVCGHYPQVDEIQGDIISADLRMKLGIPADGFGKDVVQHKDFPDWLEASYGWGWMNVLHNQNSDCRYFGKKVRPTDAGKILMHWQLDDENYRVIYGDLKTETLTAAELQTLLEKQKSQ